MWARNRPPPDLYKTRIVQLVEARDSGNPPPTRLGLHGHCVHSPPPSRAPPATTPSLQAQSRRTGANATPLTPAGSGVQVSSTPPPLPPTAPLPAPTLHRRRGAARRRNILPVPSPHSFLAPPPHNPHQTRATKQPPKPTEGEKAMPLMSAGSSIGGSAPSSPTPPP